MMNIYEVSHWVRTYHEDVITGSKALVLGLIVILNRRRARHVRRGKIF